jgi:hypothetical protein
MHTNSAGAILSEWTGPRLTVVSLSAKTELPGIEQTSFGNGARGVPITQIGKDHPALN